MKKIYVIIFVLIPLLTAMLGGCGEEKNAEVIAGDPKTFFQEEDDMFDKMLQLTLVGDNKGINQLVDSFNENYQNHKFDLIGEIDALNVDGKTFGLRIPDLVDDGKKDGYALVYVPDEKQLEKVKSLYMAGKKEIHLEAEFYKFIHDDSSEADMYSAFTLTRLFDS